jgi:hypothetical protein
VGHPPDRPTVRPSVRGVRRSPLAPLPQGRRLLATPFLAVDFLAVDFLVPVAFAGTFVDADFVGTAPLGADALPATVLGSLRTEPVFSPPPAGSIRAVPAPGANTLSWPSLHRTRYWTRRSLAITSRISPSRGGPPTRCALTTMRSPFRATDLPSLARDYSTLLAREPIPPRVGGVAARSYGPKRRGIKRIEGGVRGRCGSGDFVTRWGVGR